MTWLQRYQLRAFVANSLWIIPVVGIVLAIALSPVLRRLDQANQWTLLNYGPDGAQAIVAGLVASIFGFVVFVFSILLVAVQIASANLSPRVIAGLLSHRPVRFCLGLLVFTFVYGVGVLGRTEGDRVAQLPVAVVIVASLGSIVMFLRLIDHMSRSLRPVSVLSQVGRTGTRVISAIYPEQLGGGPEAAGRTAGLAGLPPPAVVPSRVGGVVLAFDSVGLVAAAVAADCAIELVPQVGDFVAVGDPLFRVYGGRGKLEPRVLLQRIALGPERTHEQDPAFSFRVIVDIAAKALSPAINDPTTAVLAIDQLHHLLRNVAMRRLDTGQVRDRSGRLRLVHRTPDWEDFVGLAVTEIRHFGATSIQVARRLRAMLEDLIAVLPPERQPALRAELHLLQRSAERAFSDPEDRARAQRGDSQGLGAHDRSGAPGA